MCLLVDGVPPSGFNARSSLGDFLDNVYPSLQDKDRPLEVVQEEGQIMYVPEGWYQASLPLPHPQVTGRGNEPPLHTLLESMWRASECADPSSCGQGECCGNEGEGEGEGAEEGGWPSPDIFTLSVRQQSSSPQAEDSLYFLTEKGKWLLQEGQGQRAEEVLRKATEGRDDFNSFYLLAKALIANGKLEEADKYLRLAAAANRWECLLLCCLVLSCLSSSKTYCDVCQTGHFSPYCQD